MRIHKEQLFTVPNVILMVAVAVGVCFMLILARDSARLREELEELSGTLVGPQVAQVGDVVPPMETVSLEGRKIKIGTEDASMRLIFIFSPGCGVCIDELPTWNRIAEEVREYGCQTYGITLDSAEETRRRLGGVRLNFETAVMPNMAYQRAWRVTSTPEVVLLSPRGIMEWVHYGYLSEEKITELLSIAKNKS